jgi:Chaperone of endosialidase
LSNTTGSQNTANGANALQNNTAGMGNTADGVQALYSNSTGNFNAATGDHALFSNTTGHTNTANGDYALNGNTTADANTANGASALQHNTTGGDNTAIGVSALSGNITGSFNIALGSDAGENVTSADNVICIGANVAGNNINDACYIGNIFGSTSSNGVAVLVNSNGRLGTMTSSARFKEAIKPMDRASEAILALRPVSFRYKKEIDPQGMREFGLIAEEVEKVNPDLVVRDKEGEPYSVRYDQVNAMVLNEFLKEHKRVEKLETTIAQQQKSFESRLAVQDRQIGILTAGLEKVSAQLVAGGPHNGLTGSEP